MTGDPAGRGIAVFLPSIDLRAQRAAIGMMNSLPLGIGLLDETGACKMTNTIFEQTVGCDIRGPHAAVLALALDDDRPHLSHAIARALAGDRAASECRIRLATRPDEPVVMTMVRPPPGWGFALLLAVRDIREQVKLERQVSQTTRMEAVGQLAGGIAHDFNNILTAVLGLCDQLLAPHEPGSDTLDEIRQIRQNAVRAADLVRQLLAFARQQTLRPQVLDIAPIIDGVVPLLHRLLGPGIALKITQGAGLGAVRVDPGQLEQVLVNLAVNARDAMAGNGTLTIASRALPASALPAPGLDIMPAIEHVALVVSDTGPGIPPDIAARIFEPFFTTKPVAQGTGLGLSTVYGIVKQTGGFIFTDNPPGGGARFTLYLPAAPREAAAPAVPPPLAGTVLLVEDDRAVRRVLETALVRHGLAVVTAADAFVALDILDSGDPAVDLLVSDVVMPGMDGVALIARARERRPGLHAVLMSGYAEPPQRLALGKAGVVFLAKPFDVADLIDAVRRAIAG